MADTTTFIVDLFVLLSTAVLAGELATRLGQVALVGQLLVGVVLGPTLFGPYIGLSSLSPALGAIQLLATVFILFMAGLDVVPEQIYRMGVPTVGLGIAVFAVPFVFLGLLAALLVPGATGLVPWFLGLTLSITALPVMGIMLLEFGLLKTRLGNLLINTALVNELAAVTTFAVLLQLRTGGRSEPVDIAIAGLSVGVFICVMLLIHTGLRALRSTSWWEAAATRITAGWRSKEAGFALIMVGLIGASLFSQFMGLTFVVGAFYAGILVTEESAGVAIHRSISGVFESMSWGFFIPLFFAFVGVQMNLRLLNAPIWVGLFGILLIAAVLTKVLTGYWVARWFHWPHVDALAIGNLVSSRGAVELAMAVVLLTDGVFTTQMFTLVAGVGLVTTFIAPITAGRVWRSAAAARRSALENPPAALRALVGPDGQPIGATLQFHNLDARATGPDGRTEAGSPTGSESRAGRKASLPAPGALGPPPLPKPAGPKPEPLREAKDES